MTIRELIEVCDIWGYDFNISKQGRTLMNRERGLELDEYEFDMAFGNLEIYSFFFSLYGTDLQIDVY